MSFVSTHYGGVHTKELSIDDLTNVIGGAPEGEVLNTYYPPERRIPLSLDSHSLMLCWIQVQVFQSELIPIILPENEK